MVMAIYYLLFITLLYRKYCDEIGEVSSNSMVATPNEILLLVHIYNIHRVP